MNTPPDDPRFSQIREAVLRAFKENPLLYATREEYITFIPSGGTYCCGFGGCYLVQDLPIPDMDTPEQELQMENIIDRWAMEYFHLTQEEVDQFVHGWDQSDDHLQGLPFYKLGYELGNELCGEMDNG